MQNRTALSKIFSGWWKKLFYTRVAGINGSFFTWESKSDPLGLNYLYEGVLVSDSKPGDALTEVVYSDYKLHMGDFNWIDIKKNYPKANWALAFGNRLVKDGVKNLEKAERYDHAKYKHPRTMLGQKGDDIILAVAEGRNPDDAGLTADQQADFLISIGIDDAVNCDGGGSSTMILEDKVVNYLTSERAVANGLLVYSKGAFQIIREDCTMSEIKVIGKVELSDNFTLEEFACRHCKKVMLSDYRLIEVAQSVRDYVGVPIRIVGYRCPTHNAEIGGDKNSAHLYGLALDLSSWNGDISPENIYKYIEDNFPEVEGLGIYSGHTHIDFAHNGKRVTWDNR